MPSAPVSAVERRAETLDTIAAVLPMNRRDVLAGLLTDEGVETLRHLVNEGTGENVRASVVSEPGLTSLGCTHLGRTKISDREQDKSVYFTGRPVKTSNAGIPTPTFCCGGVFR
ncbi:hypothetical protein JAU75_23240 [Ochrobactrum sp. Q0168]|nr:hypothetical protein [Ochrobactrum sp. Q0168]